MMKNVYLGVIAVLTMFVAADAMALGAGRPACGYGRGPYRADDQRCGGTVDYSGAGNSEKSAHPGDGKAESGGVSQARRYRSKGKSRLRYEFD
jgi:hypothetical protein